MHKIVALVLLASITAAAHSAGTPGASKKADTTDGASPEQAARSHYAEGLSHKEQAWRHEAEAVAIESMAAAAGALPEPAREAYERAIKAQGLALKLRPQYYEAANELGYALRKTGELRKALGAYNYALGLKPDFFEAVEYRGEAYLALGMLEKAQSAYMVLFRNQPALAGDLLTAMDGWAAQHDDEAFATWVEERRTLSETTAETTDPAEDRRAETGWVDPPSE